MNRHFDEAAKTWDSKPERLERAKKFADAVLRLIGNQPIRSAMEFGAGTGAVSFCLKDYFSSITLIDDADGMIQKINEKIQLTGANNLKAQKINLLTESYTEKHDLIYSLMALHHIQDTQKIFRIFHHLLLPGGLFIMGDLIAEDGSFHADIADFSGHHGFDVSVLYGYLKTIGFTHIQSEIFDEVRKTIKGEDKIYPLFLLSARKN